MKAKSLLALGALSAIVVLVLYKTTSALVLDKADAAEQQEQAAARAQEQAKARAAAARPLEKTTESLVPGRFVQVTFSNVDPQAPLDRDGIFKAFEQECAAAYARECALAVYDQGKAVGDGIRAWGYKEKRRKSAKAFLESRSDEAGRVIESWLGYFVAINEIYDVYLKDESDADEEFENIPLIFSFTVPKVSLDSWGEPYVEAASDKAGQPAARFFFDTRDPILKKIRPDSRILANCLSAGLKEGQALMECYIVQSDDFMRAGDRAAVSADIVRDLQFLK